MGNLIRISFLFSLLFLSSLVIAFAGDYGNDSSKYGYNGIQANSPQPKPEEEVKSDYGSKPAEIYKPKSEEKSGYDKKPEGEEKPNYEAKQYNDKPLPEEKEYGVKSKPDEEKPDYKPKEEEKQKSENEEKPYVVVKGEEMPDYGTTKPDVYKPKPEKIEKPEYAPKPKPEDTDDDDDDDDDEDDDEDDHDHDHDHDHDDDDDHDHNDDDDDKKKPYYSTRPVETEEKLGVQGLVLCKAGSKYYPIQGAIAKVTCQAIDHMGQEKIVSICSVPTDPKGYFFATVSSSMDKSLKLKGCKAFLERSPLQSCNVPTDLNKGITGAPLSGSYRVLNDKNIKLYSVGPFFFTSDQSPNSAPNNGY